MPVETFLRSSFPDGEIQSRIDLIIWWWKLMMVKTCFSTWCLHHCKSYNITKLVFGYHFALNPSEAQEGARASARWIKYRKKLLRFRTAPIYVIIHGYIYSYYIYIYMFMIYDMHTWPIPIHNFHLWLAEVPMFSRRPARPKSLGRTPSRQSQVNSLEGARVQLDYPLVN